MHLYKLSFILAVITMLPVISYANGGGHGHFGGHCHPSGHFHTSGHACHTRSIHYYPHYAVRGYRSSGYSDSRNRLAEPLAGTHELSLGMGIASDMQLSDNNMELLPPAILFSYHYYVSGGFAIGFSAGMQQVLGRDSCNCASAKNDPYDYSANTFTLAADIKWLYLSRKYIQLYGSAAAGVCYYAEQDRYNDNVTIPQSGFRPEGQLTLLGIRYGRSLGIFLEGGIGYKGLLAGGISYELR